MTEPRKFALLTIAYLVALLAIVAAIALLTGPAHATLIAHGDAAWIQAEPRYRDAEGIHCCGPTDCAAMPEGAVEETERGYLIKATGELIDWTAKGVYVSRDDHFWSCFRGGRTRCLFVPGRMG